MSKKEKQWGLFILVIIILGFLIPYTVLRDVAKWYGSFLFWSISAILVIYANHRLTKDWGEEE